MGFITDISEIKKASIQSKETLAWLLQKFIENGGQPLDILAAMSAHNFDDAAHAALFSAQAKAFDAKIRERLTGDLTLYVSPDGDDSNDGRADTPERACKTIGAALNRLTATDGGGHSASIQLAAGTYNEEVHIHDYHTSAFERVMLHGSGPSSILDTPTNYSIVVHNFAKILFHGLTLKGAFRAEHFANPHFSGQIYFDFNKGAADVYLINVIGAQLDIQGLCSVGGGDALGVLRSINGSEIVLTGQMAIPNYPTYSVAFASAVFGGVIRRGSGVISGIAKGPRHFVDWNGTINTNGQGINFFPGDVAGTANTARGGVFA